MRYHLLFFLFLISSAHSKNIQIGVSDSNPGPVKIKTVLEILECTLDKKFPVTTLKVPTLRGKNLVDKEKIDAYYPIHITAKTKSRSLIPIYIDETIILSKNPIKENMNIGLTRGNHQKLLNSFPEYKTSYIVDSVESLLKGFNENRISSIIINRSQIKKNSQFNFKYSKTLAYEDVGIYYNPQFIKKINKSKQDLNNSFLKCILDYRFPLSTERKKTIFTAMKNDLVQLKKSFIFEKLTIQEIDKKEALWKENSDQSQNFINKILKSNISTKLKRELKKFDFINEAFIFNHQGALLGSIGTSSDFDQSDEAKFSLSKTKSLNVHNISHLYFDESSRTFQTGITIPLFSNNVHIGGLYVGADINKLLKYYDIF
jgi:hypothetical protein